MFPRIQILTNPTKTSQLKLKPQWHRKVIQCNCQPLTGDYFAHTIRALFETFSKAGNGCVLRYISLSCRSHLRCVRNDRKTLYSFAKTQRHFIEFYFSRLQIDIYILLCFRFAQKNEEMEAKVWKTNGYVISWNRKVQSKNPA